MSLCRYGWSILSCCLLSTGSLACHDECHVGESRCNGNVLESCPGIDAWGPLHWESEGACEDPNPTCIEAGDQAACVAAPVAACATSQARVCADDADFLLCDDLGYLEQRSCGPEFDAPPCAWTDATGWICAR